jgi:putative transposase
MADYRRWFAPGGTFFFTVVTRGRAQWLCSPPARQILSACLREAKASWPFHIDAIVLLPDHLHAIWSLPPGDDAYSARWAWVKKEFTKRWLAAGGKERAISEKRRRRGDRGVWQPRFWEHTIEDEHDFDRHFDYIHYNPVKHGLAKAPSDWPWSSFHRWVAAGVYDANWGRASIPDTIANLEDTAME